jgi:hypothetical protein
MRWGRFLIGAVAAIIGVVWTLQGLDLLSGSSPMTGNKLWAVIGPIVALVGLVLLVTSRKRSS